MTIPLNCRSLDYDRDDKGEGGAFIQLCGLGDEQQVPPMRYAPEFLALYQGKKLVTEPNLD
jgi:hypothetical protein